MSSRHTILRLSFSAIIAIIGISVSMLTFAQSAETLPESVPLEGKGTITIEQKNAFNETLGVWTLLKPGGAEQQEGKNASTTITDTPAGNYSLFFEVPSGMSPTIRTYHGAEQLQLLDRPQINFKLVDGEHLTLIVHYALTRAGIVSVQSDPPGLAFTLKGPDGLKEEGTTPASFENTPVGQYNIQYETLQGCNTLPVKNSQLEDKGRITFSITLICSAADKLRNRQESKGEQFVVIQVDNKDVTLRDVPQNTWFATFVYEAARRNVLSGYKDEAGNPSGEFGPENNVTVAELAKMAHRLGGISEESFVGKNPENPHAQNQWFSSFLASAESRGWTIYKDATIDPLRPATRAEVVVTFLQVLDIPLRWQKGKAFTDVTTRTRFASSIETAAADGIVSGRNDASGVPLNLFGPEDPINRAEIAKIIFSVFEKYKFSAK